MQCLHQSFTISNYTYFIGKSPEDSIKLSILGLKPGFKIMMMGSLEEDISTATTAPENTDDVINDLDLTEEEIALENREEYLTKVSVSVTSINNFMKD